MDSRTSTILINLDFNINSDLICNRYDDFSSKINETVNENHQKTYDSLASALKESYLTGSLRYGKSFIS